MRAITYIINFDDKRYSGIRTTSKMRIFRFAQVEKNKSGVLRVVYDSTKDLWNEVCFENYKQLRQGLSQATEPELLKYVEQWDG